MLIHFQYGVYSYNFEAAEAVFRACPETVFIGHAQGMVGQRQRRGAERL